MSFESFESLKEEIRESTNSLKQLREEAALLKAQFTQFSALAKSQSSTQSSNSNSQNSSSSTQNGIQNATNSVSALTQSLSLAETKLQNFKDKWNEFNLQMLAGNAYMNMVTQSGQNLADAFYQMGAAGKLSASLLGAAMKKMAVNVIKGVASQAMVKAAFHTAEGLGALAWGNGASAALHFKSAATFAGIGAIAGVAAGALGGGSSSSASDQSSSSSNSSTENTVNQTIVINGDLDQSNLEKLQKQQETQNAQLSEALLGG